MPKVIGQGVQCSAQHSDQVFSSELQETFSRPIASPICSSRGVAQHGEFPERHGEWVNILLPI